jgi:uncharacterized ferritin-like protein (DUF455 family)
MKLAHPLDELRQAALHWLSEPDPAIKAAGVTAMAGRWSAGGMTLTTEAVLNPDLRIPGHPEIPELVPPSHLKRRGMSTVEGRAVLIHALAHIEFNAINLALDVIWRFPDMPAEFYADWLQVAAEEAYHYTLLANHLQTLGHAYGDFPAHNGLWEMADRTRDDVLARIALIPRTMEARGLDVSPGLRDKLAQAGDHEAAAILGIILRDEIGHVRIGNHWYGWLCQQRQLEPLATYDRLAAEYKAPVLRGPFNIEARRAAGFTEAELDALLSLPCSAAGGS